MRIVNIDEMANIEKNTFSKPIISETLIIENVGVKCSEFIDEIAIENDCPHVVVVVGKGNNGADGVAVARHLHGMGSSVDILRIFPKEKQGKELELQLQMAEDFGLEVLDIDTNEDLINYFDKRVNTAVVDTILGTGFKPPLDDYLISVIEVINASASIIISLDIPSGLSGDSGNRGDVAIMADFTLAIELPKIGHFIDQGPKHIGELTVIPVGFPQKTLMGGNKFLLTQDVLEGIEKRSKFDYKNCFGHVLVVGGSSGLSGAAVLASTAALKVGAGLVTALTWKNSLSDLNSTILPEIMTGVITDDIDYSKFDAAVVGPGLGRTKEAQSLIEDILKKYKGSLIIDADGINNLSKKHFDMIQKREGLTVLTPHMGEFARLLGIEVRELTQNIQKYLLPFAKDHQSAVLLKSSTSYLAMPSGELFINYAPNDGMATAGSGDVLAGIMGGILAAKDADQRRMHIIGRSVVIHSVAGALARESYGARFMSASNLIEKIQNVFEHRDETVE